MSKSSEIKQLINNVGLSTKEIATRLGVSYQTIYNYGRTGRVPAHQLSRLKVLKDISPKLIESSLNGVNVLTNSTARELLSELESRGFVINILYKKS